VDVGRAAGAVDRAGIVKRIEAGAPARHHEQHGRQQTAHASIVGYRSVASVFAIRATPFSMFGIEHA
jgi:hypothetical protein